MDIDYILNIINKKFENIDNYIDKIVTDILFIKVSDKSTQTEHICCKLCCPKKRTNNKYTVEEKVHLMNNANQTLVKQPTSINKKQRIVKFIDNMDNNNNSNENNINSNDNDGNESECIDIVVINNKDSYEDNNYNNKEKAIENNAIEHNAIENNVIKDDICNLNISENNVSEPNLCENNASDNDNNYDYESLHIDFDIQKNEKDSLINSCANEKTSLMDTVLIDSDSESDSDSSFGNEYEFLDIHELANEKKEN